MDYCYRKEGENIVDLIAEEICITSASVKLGLTGAILFAIILAAGLIAICFWKCKNMYLERLEYKKFIEEQNLSEEINPLYKDPKSLYRNPLYNKNK